MLVRRRIVVFVVMFFLWIGFSVQVRAQLQENGPAKPSGGKGAIAGTVLDPTSAVVPEITVTVIEASGETQAVNSDEKGEYRIDGLTPGKYKVVVGAAGFADYLKEGIVVTADEITKLDISLATAAATAEKVEVTAGGAAAIEQGSSEIVGKLTDREVTTYALNGRNFTQLIALAPGVSNQTGQDEALVGVKGSVKYSVNGGRVEYNTYDVDGGDILNASINGSSSTLIVYPSIDAISDLQVLTSNYGAMYGRSASGTILASTKSGGAAFHGDAYFFLRNNHLNARNFFDTTRRAPLYQKYEPGGTIGGPLYIPGVFNTRKDKTFFFFSEEYRHDREPVNFNQGVPSAMERDCHNAPDPSFACLNSDPTLHFADFSDVCPAPKADGSLAYFARSKSVKAPYFPDCPGLPAQTAGGAPVGAYQPLHQDNLVPVDARSWALLNTGLIPQANAISGCNSSIPGQVKKLVDPTDPTKGSTLVNNNHCYNIAVSPLTTWRQELVRIDHNFIPTQKIYFRYIHDSWSTVVPAPQWGFLHNSFPTVQNQFVGPGTSIVLHYISTAKSRLVNDVAMAYTTDHITLTNLAGPGVSTLDRSQVPVINNAPCLDPSSTTCGLGYIFNNGFGNKIPGIIIGGTNAAYGGQGFQVDSSYMPWRHSNPTYSPRYDGTLALGRHTLQFGALFIFAQRNEVNPPSAQTREIFRELPRLPMSITLILRATSSQTSSPRTS